MFIDKHPLNTFKLPLIARLFPDARILFARRDPRDVRFIHLPGYSYFGVLRQKLHWRGSNV